MGITFNSISRTDPEVFSALPEEYMYFLLFWRFDSEQLGHVKPKHCVNKLQEAMGEKNEFSWTSEYLML